MPSNPEKKKKPPAATTSRSLHVILLLIVGAIVPLYMQGVLWVDIDDALSTVASRGDNNSSAMYYYENEAAISSSNIIKNDTATSQNEEEAEEAEEDLGTAAAPMIASLESGNKQLIVEGGDNNNNNNAHANSIRQDVFHPSTIWNETQWRTCFDFSWQQSSQKQSFAKTMPYSTKALHDLVTVSHVPMFVLATAMRPPKLSSEVCSLPFITMVTADHNYTVDGNVYDRDTQNCWDPNVQERPFNMLCQRYDFAWQLDFAKTHAESVGSEWILLFEDDVSFCPGLFEYVGRMMHREDTNIVFLSRGQLGMLVRVSFIERYIQLIYPDADEKNPKPVDAKLTYAGKEEGVLWTKINMVFHPRKSPSTLDHIYDSDRSCYELGTHRTGNKYIPFVDPVTMAVGYLDKKGNTVNIKVPFPIFVPSLPTPGSKTVHGYFQCGNQASAHGTVQVPSPSGELKKMYAGKCIRRNIQEHRQAFEKCGDYDIYLDTTVLTKPSMHSKKVKDCFFPPLDALEEIYASYPNATWLLLTRNTKSWVYSARRDMDTTWRNCASFDGLLPNPASKATEKYQDYERFYDQHNHRIRQFVTDHPSLTFLEVSLEGNNTAQILEQEVGISSKCWGQ